MLYPALNELKTQRLWTEQFLGLDRRPRTYDGTFDAMGNMTGDPWPLLSSRGKRGKIAELTDGKAMCILNKLAWVDGDTLYFDGEATALNDLSTQEGMLPKRLVTMGAYILVFPDKKYYNTVDPTDHGDIERTWESSGNVSFSICAMDGVEYPSNKTTASNTAPANPDTGDYWIDTSGETHLLYQYLDEWVAIPTVYVKIAATGIGQGLNTQDNLSISGVSYSGSNETVQKQLEALNQTHVVQAAGNDFVVVIGMLDQTYTQTSGKVKANRQLPEMDFMIECNNRLWGCRYGEQDGETVNRIYASALGDFRNFQKFQGTSQDSYYVNIGTEGPFTGAIVHRSNPVFFKANCMHRIYGEKPSNFQSQVTLCDGVQEGSGGTLASKNGVLYYLSANGVTRFDTLPETIGNALGSERLKKGVGAVCGGKYYLSAEGEDGQWDLYVFDTERNVWHRQDDSHALSFAATDGEIYMLQSNGIIWALRGTEGTEEPGDVTWYAETAPMGYEYPNHQYLSRFVLRMKMGGETDCTIKVMYDGDGVWHEKGTVTGTGKVKMYVLPIVPRRCEQMKVRIEGHGDAQLFGVARDLAIGRE